MALLRTFGPVLLTSALVAGGLLPGTPASAAPAEEPVSVIPLTAGDGSLTGIADEGLAALAAPAQPQARALRSTAQTADATPAAPDTDGVAVLTAPIATSEFYVAGVTWDGADAMPEDAALFIRVMENGQWQDWAELEVEGGTEEPGAIGGTEPYTAAGAEAVQVQITGDASRLPANVRLNLTPEWPSGEETVADAPTAAVAPDAEPLAPEPAATLPYQQSAARTAAAPQSTTAVTDEEPSFGVKSSSTVRQPSIVTRAQWGADDSRVRHSDHVALRAAVIHHTAGTNSYTQAQSASIVRGIHYYHAVTRDWGDIGYNFLVDRFGTIYEGRKGSLTAKPGQMVIGAHAAPRNTNTMGLSVMGDFTKARVPQAAMDAFADVIAWQFSLAGLSATEKSGLTSTGTYARPAGQNLGRVFAHRDVSNTACPGDEIYSRIGELARAADARMASSGTSPSTPTPAPEPVTGHVYLNNGWGPVADVDYPFAGDGADIVVGDWDGNGTDTLGTRRGNIFSVYNENAPGAEAWTIAYGRPADEVFIGDWDGDGKDSIAVRRGATFYVKNKVLGGAADHEFVYGRPGDEVFVGDWNQDGKDTFAVRRGQILHVKNNFAGGPADQVIAYGKPGDTMLVGDWNGDGIDTFAVRRGAVYHVKNSISTGVADLVIPYGREQDIVLVGDWNGDRTDTLGVYRPAR
ncbi:MAG TPA: N-acetylmuramoyl-L-alanine amidase [Phototrophicaceae bacterium]|nr:N-acetylmuramoyl-L-alanine amidase [Phototrophicaceae bacterium]